MKVQWVFNRVDDAVKSKLLEAWERKSPRLQKLLTSYPNDLQAMRLAVYGHQENPHRVWYELRVAIHLPTGTLSGHEEGDQPLAVLDKVVDALVAEVKKHKDHVRKDFVYKRKSRRRMDLTAAGPLLESSAGRQHFVALLRPMLRLLRDQAQRELRIRELEGDLHRGEMTAAGLLDEVEVKAREQFDRRPANLPLDLWLTQLLHQVLKEWIKQEPRHHAELSERAEEVLPEDVPQVDDQEWWQWLLDDSEQPLTLEEAIPDRQRAEVDDAVADQELKERMLSLLSELPELQRQAFMLNVLDDFDPSEIAALQNRSENEVRADIQAARRTLHEQLRGQTVRY